MTEAAHTPTQRQPRRVVSGMRPTGRLHLGHYHGAVKNWIEISRKAECFFFSADWHALTSEYKDTSNIAQAQREMFADWIAAGLDPDRCTLFIQSHVKQHAELFLLLAMITPLGWLERVPTYKEQQEQLKEKDLNTFGFLGYPVLQTADVALYGADAVPVGQDQVSHLEVAREIVRKFNHHFAKPHKPILVEPHPYLTDVPKILGLDGRKMSKSYGNAVELGEDPESARKRIMVAVTDPARKRPQRSRPSRGLPHLLAAPRLQPAPDRGTGRPRVPHRWHRLRRLQEDAAAKPHSGAGEAPGRARRAGPQSRPGRRAGATGHQEGHGGGGADHDHGPRRGETDLRAEVETQATQNGAFAVALPVFEGPLDLLLSLIQDHKLDIFDIPISFVTDRYLEYMNTAQALNIDLAGEYLLMAATLAHIKSRMLLPREQGADAPDGELGPDPREELVRRLLEYQKYKDAALRLSALPQLGRDVFVRRAKEELPLAPEDAAYFKSPEISVYRLIELMARVLKERKIEIPHEVFVERLSIGDRISVITDRLRGDDRITFTSLFVDLGDRDRHRVVPTFLAVLEMARLKLVRVHQPERHSEIYIARTEALLTSPAEGASLDYRG